MGRKGCKEIKKLVGKSIIIFLLISPILKAHSYNDSLAEKVKINDGWKFKLINDTSLSEDNFQLNSFDDSGWETVSLPHTAHIEPLIVNNQWQGICWYRKALNVEGYSSNKKYFLEIEAAMNYSKIWINGVEVSQHQGGYLPVVIDIAKYIKKGKNLIAVRLDNTDNPITGPKPLKILDFNMYGGLYRNVWLITKEKIYISNPTLANKVAGGGTFITYPKVTENESIIQIKTNVVNEEKKSKKISLVYNILYNGKIVKQQKGYVKSIESGKDSDFIETISLPQAYLWSPDNPNLYELKTQVFVGDKMVDKEVTRFGIREFKFKDNQLYINNNKTFLRGVNRHQEYPFIGYALSDNAQYRDAKKIKEGGFDYIRLSHYPQSPAFLDACDELGLVVIDAILGWQYYNDTDSFRDYCYRSTAELIRRDRNHPCVLAWEVSLNETKMPIFFMKKLNNVTHAEYPGNTTYSCGWMDDVYDIFLQARQHRLLHPSQELKDKPYSVSEYGDWEYYSTNAGLNQDKLFKNLRIQKSSRQLRSYGEARMLQQATNVQEAHNDNLNTPAYSDSYWVMYDYNRGYHDDLESSGLMDIFRLPKFAYYFYKSQREIFQDTVLHIASYWNKNSQTNVKIYSNCDKVKLFLNDSLVAEEKPDKDSISNNLLHPPFTFNIGSFKEGTLKAVGLVNKKEVATDIVTTPKQPVGLKIWLDQSGKKPKVGVNDVLFLHIAAVDENGTITPDFSDEINLKIEGDVKIINGDNIRAEAGIATALIRIGITKKPIQIRVNSNHKIFGSLEFNVK